MKKTISLYDFRDAFKSSSTYKDNFSYDWLDALFDYLDQYESETETELDFDIVSICCDYSEYESAIDAVNDYTGDAPYLLDEDEANWLDLLELSQAQEEKALEWLEYNTQVIIFNTGIIIQDF